MTRLHFQFSALALALSCFCCGLESAAHAQHAADVKKEAPSTQNSWYYTGGDQPEKSIARQKAERRAEQRMDRLASQRWYGFQPGRPTAAGMPFTTMYSPAWSRPGGRPFSWYSGYPTVVYNYGYRWW